MKSPPATVADLMAQARRWGVERLDAQRLLAHHLQCSRSWLLAHDTDPLPAGHADAALRGLQRCAEGEPLAYVLGEQAFHGLVLQVSPAVLIPRPDTETLVDWALELLAGPLQHAAEPEVADLGTGSGAIALAVKQVCPRARVRASDASADALAVAQANANRLGLDVEFLQGHWWQPWPDNPAPDGRRLHLALSNPPYIARHDSHLAALSHEPTSALVPPGEDGLSALREIAANAPAHLRAGGWLLLEHGHDQADAVAQRLHALGYAQVQHRHDRGSRRRCTGGCWPG
jgi:release factor glutamine methyltransferase